MKKGKEVLMFIAEVSLQPLKSGLQTYLCDIKPQKSRGIHWIRSLKRYLCYIQQVIST